MRQYAVNTDGRCLWVNGEEDYAQAKYPMMYLFEPPVREIPTEKITIKDGGAAGICVTLSSVEPCE